jgi:flavin reductase (DIM6/NTAB) family NADH-FMN oxidoreductase RutF
MQGSMERTPIAYSEHYQAVMSTMTSRGLLLGSYDAAGKPNAMTIGWGAIGSIWGIPVWTVLVRPSRYTYRCIEHSAGFTVNVPTDDMVLACAGCGSKSGRDMDKFKEFSLEAGRAQSVLAPVIEQCPLVYECQVVHANDILPDKLQNEILTGSYVDGDYHRIYYGKILRTTASADVADLLGN